MMSFPNLGKLGRLGNQLFQISSTIGIAKTSNQLAIFPEWDYQQFFKNRLPTAKILVRDILQEKYCNYQEVKLPEPARPIGLNGYFQSYKYFENSEKEIRKLFEFSSEIENYISEKYSDTLKECSAFVHVRRGDYETLSAVYESQSMDYYNSCLNFIGCSKFAVFSDDIDWCKEAFSSYNCEFISEREHSKSPTTQDSENESQHFLKEDLVEFALMSKFKDSIICNSSFSWWAAYLNKNTNKKVCAPKNWFTDEHAPKIYNLDNGYDYIKDLIPTTWNLV